jgi:RimJ/RimL family protein N-acetyltransferase
MILKTKRLILRPITPEDATSITENVNNLNVSRWLLVVPYPYKKKDAIFWIKNSQKKAKEKPRKDYSFGIELQKEDKIIGGIGLHKVDRYHGKADLGYWLGQKYWRNGYGSEALETLLDLAFNKLKLRKLEAGVFVSNPSSGKLLEKYGFKKEGERIQTLRCKADGKIKDEYLYGLLRRDYNGKR